MSNVGDVLFDKDQSNEESIEEHASIHDENNLIKMAEDERI